MNTKKRETLDSLLIERDGYACGFHVGGCSEEALENSETNLDHIFPRAFFRDTKSLPPRQYDKPWNVQRMHMACNNEKKGGFISGFPVFKCICHWLQIAERNGKYALKVTYCPSKGVVYQAVVVPFGRFDVGDGSVSNPNGLLPRSGDHVAVGLIHVPDHGMVIKNVDIDLRDAFAGGRVSFTFVGRAKRGKLRRGKNGHVFPLLAAQEVAAFNQFERKRVDCGGIVDDNDNLLVTFNSEIIPFGMRYDASGDSRI